MDKRIRVVSWHVNGRSGRSAGSARDREHLDGRPTDFGRHRYVGRSAARAARSGPGGWVGLRPRVPVDRWQADADVGFSRSGCAGRQYRIVVRLHATIPGSTGHPSDLRGERIFRHRRSIQRFWRPRTQSRGRRQSVLRGCVRRHVPADRQVQRHRTKRAPVLPVGRSRTRGGQ